MKKVLKKKRLIMVCMAALIAVTSCLFWTKLDYFDKRGRLWWP